MWVLAYDPKDQEAILAGTMAYWGFRHGSPLPGLNAVWLPSERVGLLTSTVSESADLYLAILPDLKTPRKAYGLNDPLPTELESALVKLTKRDFVLAVEFTRHANWSSNTIERARIVYDAVVELGVPTLYAMPGGSHALRKTDRRGDANRQQKSLGKVITMECQRLVEANEAVTFEKLKAFLETNSGRRLKKTSFAQNLPDPKVPLFVRTLQDTYDVPCATAQMDAVVSIAPTKWSLAGCQMNGLFDTMKACIRFAATHGRAPGVEDGLFAGHNRDDDGLMRAAIERNGARRHRLWDAYSQTRGFPNGSLAIADAPIRRNSLKTNFSLHAPTLAEMYVLDASHPKKSVLEWVAALRSAGRPLYRKELSEEFPTQLLKRPLILTYTVSEYGSEREDVTAFQNVNERTYTSKLLVMDVCAARESVTRKGRPRAMAPDPKNRRCILAAKLPMLSDLFFNYYEGNARYRTYADFADILLFNDGAYLGLLWAPPKTRIF